MNGTNEYGELAEFYRTGHYVNFSENMAERFQDTLALFDVDAGRVLDVACGEGTFAVSIAEQGFDVTGIDVSEQMIELARGRAGDSDVDVTFHVKDAREFEYRDEFDVVTCWFDSINHVLEEEGVTDVFERVNAALVDGGAFVFDAITIRALASFVNPYELSYGERSSAVIRNDEQRFESYTDVHFDYEENRLSFTMTGFTRKGDRWQRVEETYRERGYPLDEIERWLRTAGFTDVVRTESLNEIETPDEAADRVYFVARNR